MSESLKKPLVSIITKPNFTLNSLEKIELKVHQIFFISIIYGLEVGLFVLLEDGFDDTFPLLFNIALYLIVGTIVGVIFLILHSLFALLIGKIFRGKGTFTQMLTLSVLSGVPFIFALPIVLFAIVLFGPSLFSDTSLYINEVKEKLLLILAIIEISISIWYIVLFTIGFVKVHQFKKAKYFFYVVTWLNAFLLILGGVSSFLIFQEGNHRGVLNNTNFEKAMDMSFLQKNNEKALQLIEEGRYEEALNRIEEILSHDPKNDIALSNKGYALTLLGRNEEAIDVLIESISIEPNDSYEYINLGNAYLGIDYFDKANESYNLALREGVNTDTSSVYYGLGITHYHLGDYEKAIKNLDLYLNFEKEDLDAYWYLVNSHVGNDELDVAITALQQIIEIDPTDFEAYTYIGDIQLDQENYSAALQTYEEIISKFPDQPHGYYGKAEVLAFRDKSVDAVNFLQTVYKIDSYYAEYAIDDYYFDPIRERIEFIDFIKQFNDSSL